MDIWKWVSEAERQLREAGNYRLAQLIYEVPTNASNGRVALAQAALPEAIAGAKAAGMPWLEVYFRHWVINARVCTAKEGEAALKDAVALFEFAHRPETMSCPQSVCTTQDIASCYGNVDGPGYANERIAVCKETLGRIDSSWGCFRCISVEMIDALVDGARPAEGLAFAEGQLPYLQESGDDQSSDLHFARARAQFAVGDFSAALATLEMTDKGGFGDDTDVNRYARACLRFHLLAAAGRDEEAWAALPPETEGKELGEHVELAKGLEVLLQRAPGKNDFHLGRRTAAALRRYSAAGAHRLALDAAGVHVRLAVARGARWTAMQGLALARPHLAKLRAPLGAPEAFAALEAMVAAMPAESELPAPAEAMAEYIRRDGGQDAEKDLELLLSALVQLPGDADLAILASLAMKACGGAAAAREFLWTFLRRNPAAEDVASELMAELLEARDETALRALAEFLKEIDPVKSHWCLARMAFVTEAWHAVGTHAARVLELKPGAVGARAMWADAAIRGGDFEQALALLEELAKEEPEPGNAHWDAIVAASALRRWDRVRALAAALGMKLEQGDAPVDEEWGTVRVQYTDDGETRERYAERTGPATARIEVLSGIFDRQAFGEVVVFDPAPLEQRPDDLEEGERFIQLYRTVTTLDASSYGSSYLVDGVKPDEAAFSALTEALESRGWKWSVRSDDDYTVYDEETETEFPGVYFVVAAPAGTPAAALDEALHELTAHFEHALCWRGLADEAGGNVEHHDAVAARYGI